MEHNKLLKISVIIISLGLLVLFPFMVGQSSYYMGLVVMICIYSIATMSLNLLTGYGGQISVGQGGFLMLGAYSAAILSTKLGLPILLTLPIAGLISAIVSLVIGLPAVRLKGHFLAVATLGFGLAIPEIALNWKGLTGGYSGMGLMRPSVVASDVAFYYVILFITAFVVWVMLNIAGSRLGRAFIAIKDSEVAAASTGINVANYKTLMFMIAAFFTGISGGLYAYWIGYVSPDDFTIMTSFFLLAMIVVGGLASVWGALLGAILFTAIPHFADSYVGVTNLFIGISVVLVILFRPNGIVSIFSFRGGNSSNAPNKISNEMSSKKETGVVKDA